MGHRPRIERFRLRIAAAALAVALASIAPQVAGAADDVTRVVSPTDAEYGVYSDSLSPSISRDGRIVAFTGYGHSIAAADSDSLPDIYLRDMQAPGLTLVSRASGGAKSNGGSGGPSMSADGRFVAFYSLATNLDPDDTNTDYDVYLRDVTAGTTTLVSRASGTTAPAGGGVDPRISADGRYVAFTSCATC